MKNRYFRSGCIGGTLLALFLAVILYIAPANAGGRSITLEGKDVARGEGDRVTLTLTEYKLGVFTVTGTLISVGGTIYPIKGTYSERETADEKPNMKGTALVTAISYKLDVDGYVSIVDGKFYANVTIKDPKREIIFFQGTLVGTEVSKGTDAKPEEKSTAEIPETPKPDVEPDKIPTVDGNEPSPASTPEEWNGKWKGKTKSAFTIGGATQVEKEGEFEFRTVRDGQKIRVIGTDREVMFNLSSSNPNVAMFKEQKRETLQIGWADVVDKRVIFLREGRLYLTIRQEVTGHTTIPNIPDVPVTEIHDTIGIGDRVK